MAKSMLKVALTFPAPCQSLIREAASVKLLQILNKQIQVKSAQKGLPQCIAISCAPIARTMGSVLPCGWNVTLALPKELFTCKKILESSLKSITLKYLKSLRIPILPSTRKTIDESRNQKEHIRKDRYKVRLSETTLLVSVTIGVGCSCVVKRYLTYFKLSGVICS